MFPSVGEVLLAFVPMDGAGGLGGKIGAPPTSSRSGMLSSSSSSISLDGSSFKAKLWYSVQTLGGLSLLWGDDRSVG